MVEVDLTALYTQNATEPEKVASPQYAVFAEAYLATVEAFNTSDKHSAMESYQAMVNACMACHQSLCPGPKARIRYMYYSPGQMDSLE
ncbi:MAG: hypothetical protein R3330_12240 [Saprospiraceae bacterium]|nr:hypothetical protein [Saprospiraceae bacterium]